MITWETWSIFTLTTIAICLTPGLAVLLVLSPRQKLMTTNSNTIKLDQFLKLVGIAPTGGQAKLIIQGGDVLVNDTLETRRGRKLVSGDRVTVGGQTFSVELDNE